MLHVLVFVFYQSIKRNSSIEATAAAATIIDVTKCAEKERKKKKRWRKGEQK